MEGVWFGVMLVEQSNYKEKLKGLNCVICTDDKYLV